MRHVLLLILAVGMFTGCSRSPVTQHYQGRLTTGEFVNRHPIESGYAEHAVHEPDLVTAAHGSRIGTDYDYEHHDRFSEEVAAKLKAEDELDAQAERERRAMQRFFDCPEARERASESFRLKYDLTAYDEKYKGTDKERQAFDETTWDRIELELLERPR